MWELVHARMTLVAQSVKVYIVTRCRAEVMENSVPEQHGRWRERSSADSAQAHGTLMRTSLYPGSGLFLRQRGCKCQALGLYSTTRFCVPDNNTALK